MTVGKAEGCAQMWEGEGGLAHMPSKGRSRFPPRAAVRGGHVVVGGE